MATLILVILTIALAVFAIGISVHWCYRFVVEEFDDKDVPRLFQNSRGGSREDEVNFDHEADPDVVPDELQQETYNLDAFDGGLAMELYKQRPEFFETLKDWYESDVAYDLEELEKQLDIPDSAIVGEILERV